MIAVALAREGQLALGSDCVGEMSPFLEKKKTSKSKYTISHQPFPVAVVTNNTLHGPKPLFPGSWVRIAQKSYLPNHNDHEWVRKKVWLFQITGIWGLLVTTVFLTFFHTARWSNHLMRDCPHFKRLNPLRLNIWPKEWVSLSPCQCLWFFTIPLTLWIE